MNLTLPLLMLACTPDSIEGALPVTDTGSVLAPIRPRPSDIADRRPVHPLEVVYLGVGGYLIRHGDDAVLTPPLFSNPDLVQTTLGEIETDAARVSDATAHLDLSPVKAILVGHAHYDHLMDAPPLWPRTDQATIYGSQTTKHLLSAYAPDRPEHCEPQTAPPGEIPRDRVVALNDPTGPLGRDLVDYRMCPQLDPGLADGAGDWIAVEDSHIRVRALCSVHPDQFGPIHFAPGQLDADLCEPPRQADGWVEGLTLAYLIDFLDPHTGTPVHRVYYQDAPTELPTGLFDPGLLDDKAVDVALLNVGSYLEVPDHPAATLRSMQPRYTIGGHWEDFFRSFDRPIEPIIGHDIDEYGARAEEQMPPGTELPARVEGIPTPQRQWVPLPDTRFEFPAER